MALACCLGWLASVPGARAQEPTTITYREAVALALERNTAIERARTDVHVSGVVRTREWMDFLPDLQLSTTAARTFGRSFSQEEGQILSETNETLGAEMSASMILFDGFERTASLRRAGLDERASELRLERALQDVAVEVIAGFTALLQNRQLAEVREQELETQREILQQVEAFEEVGRRPVSDVYQQQAATAEAEVAAIEATRQVALSETELIRTLQLDPVGSYAFVAPDADRVSEGEVEDLDRLLERAFERRADLEALRATISARRQGVRAAGSGYWPSLSLGYDYGSDYSSAALRAIAGTGTDPRTITIVPDDGGPPVTFPVPGTGADPELFQPSLLDQLDQRRGGSLRLSLSLPVFDRWQTRTAVEQAEADLLNARYDLQDLRQEIALQVRQAVLDLGSARARLEAAERQVVAADRARQAARRRYELGAATFVELSQANDAYVAAASARVRARYGMLLARQLLGYHTGELDTEGAFDASLEGVSP